jgi:type IV pilus assembly protein PilA
MVTIAIVGILAAIAVPAYSYYITKGHYSEITQAISEQKVYVAECGITHAGDFSSCTKTVNYSTDTLIETLNIDKTGAITVNPRDAHNITSKDTLKLTPNYSIHQIS